MNKSIFFESYKKWGKKWEEAGALSESDRQQNIKEWLSKSTDFRNDILKYLTNYALYEIYEQLDKLFNYLDAPEMEILCGALILISFHESSYITFSIPTQEYTGFFEFNKGGTSHEVNIFFDEQVGERKVGFQLIYRDKIFPGDMSIHNKKHSSLVVKLCNNVSIKNSRQIKLERYFRPNPPDHLKYKNNLPPAKIDELVDGSQVFRFSKGEINSDPFMCAEIILFYLGREYDGISWMVFDDNNYNLLDGF